MSPLIIFMTPGGMVGVPDVDMCLIFLVLLLKSEEMEILFKEWHTGHQQSGFLWVGQAANYPPGTFRPSTNLKKPDSGERGGSPLQTPATNYNGGPSLPLGIFISGSRGRKMAHFLGKAQTKPI